MNNYCLSLRQRAKVEHEIRRRGLRSPLTFDDWLVKTQPSLDWQARHLTYIRGVINRVISGEIPKLMVFTPPRHGKTQQNTISLSAWYLERYPENRVIIGAYNSTLAEKFSRKARKLTRAKIDNKRTAVDDWETEAGGGMRAVGVGGGVTGMGGDLILLDDPVKSRAEANSQTYRDKCWDWYTDDIYTRLEPGGAIILTMTRWHADDLAGRILESDDAANWTVITLPAIAGPDDQINRQPGEALWPDRYSGESLQVIRSVIGDRSFEALYQQGPTISEGNLFKPDLIQVVEAIPAGCTFIRSWDLAATDQDGDWTAGPKVGRTIDGRYIIVDMVRIQGGPEDVEAAMINTANRDGHDCRIRFPQDPGQAGKAQVAYFTRQLAGFAITSKAITGDKVTRAEPFASQVNVGNVMMLRASWNSALIDELRAFPNGKHDDQVDSLSDGFAELTDNEFGLLDFLAQMEQQQKGAQAQ